MQTTHRNLFTTIRTEGGILPADLLQHIASGDGGIDGLTPESYHLVGSEKLNEAINRSWNHLLGVWSAFRARLLSGPAGRLSSADSTAAPAAGNAGANGAAQRADRSRLHSDDTGFSRDVSLERGSGGSATSRGSGTASPLSEALTGPTRERWLLPLFQELGYGRLLPSKAVDIDGKDYPISHSWQHAPIHLIGCGLELDRRTPGAVGAARMSPHGMVQEFLNRTDDHLWAFVSNGFKLRILRDNVSLTRQAYVEFDLESMMEGEVYSDFSLLWLLCHQSRIESERPEQCRLEKWSQFAQEQGTRALEQLRTGVEEAISALGRGFLAHPANAALKDKLRTGDLDKQDYYRQLLRIVYRVLFVFVAEDRDVLLDPKASVDAKERYTRWYSTLRLRQLAAKHRGTDHPDLWQVVKLVFRALGDAGVSPPNPRPGRLDSPDPSSLDLRSPHAAMPRADSASRLPSAARNGNRGEATGHAVATGAAQCADQSRPSSDTGFQRDASLWQGGGDSVPTSPGCPALGLPALGSFLWSDDAVPDLMDCELRNRDLLTAVRVLAITTEQNVRRTVDFKNLGSEELGSVYESLLELHPELNADSATFALNVAAGHERKTTGSYYTPSSLVNCLLDSALDPVLDEAAKKPNPEQTILDLRVCDPASGSGHFLIAAAHRIAKRLAAVRTGDDEPAPEAVHQALRDVIGHCIYGVDINPMAVELCRSLGTVFLWLTEFGDSLFMVDKAASSR